MLHQKHHDAPHREQGTLEGKKEQNRLHTGASKYKHDLDV